MAPGFPTIANHQASDGILRLRLPNQEPGRSLIRAGSEERAGCQRARDSGSSLGKGPRRGVVGLGSRSLMGRDGYGAGTGAAIRVAPSTDVSSVLRPMLSTREGSRVSTPVLVGRRPMPLSHATSTSGPPLA